MTQRYEVRRSRNRFSGAAEDSWAIWDTVKGEPLVCAFETESEAVAQCEAAQAERNEEEVRNGQRSEL